MPRLAPLLVVLVLVLAGCCAVPPSHRAHRPQGPPAQAPPPPPLAEPYLPLNNLAAPGPPVPASPDPLVATRWTAAANASALQVYEAAPVRVSADPAASFSGLASLTTAHPNVTVRGAGTITIDFGVEGPCWLEVQVSPALPSPSTTLLLSVSEYSEPGVYNAGPPHPNKTAAPVVYADGWLRLELNPELYEGVRYGFVHVVGPVASPFALTGARAVCQVLPTNYSGAFSSGDALLDQVWYTAAYTVKVNLLPSGLGSVLVDRGDRISWTGDAHTAQHCSMLAFGNFALVAQNLARTSCATCSNGIEAYKVYWLLSVLDFYRATGDEATLVAYADNVDARIAHGVATANTNASLHFYGSDDRVGADFEYPSAMESQRAYACLVLRAIRGWIAAVRSCHSCSQARVPGYVAAADQLEAVARQHNQSAAWHAPYGIHSAAEAVLAGIVTPAEMAVVFEREFASAVQVCSFSMFNMYFILQAMAAMGRQEEATAAVARCWGPMIALGATTFWETTSPEWLRFLPRDGLLPPTIPNGQTGYTSMAHPWSCGSLPFLTNHRLGIRATRPGYRRFEFAPAPRLPSIAGSVPTVHGAIHAELRPGWLRLVVPPTTEARLRIPLPRGAGAVEFVPHLDVAVESEGGVLFAVASGLGPGEHTFALHPTDAAGEALPAARPHRRSSGPAAVPALPPASAYAAAFVGRDNTTQGSWVGKYGREGYVLFSFDGKAGHTVSRLPPNVQSSGPSVAKGRNAVFAASGSKDPRALLDPTDPGGTSRALGYIATANPHATLQTFLVDTVMAPGSERPYRISLYFCDFGRLGTRQMVEARDLVKYELVAPSVGLVDGFAEGVYLTYQTNTSIRFRINQIRNGDAVLSALFFDPV